MSSSFWIRSTDLPLISPLDRDMEDDIVVIGAGIAGLSAAYLLLKENKSVTVITDRTIASGETSRTTAHLTCILDERFFVLEKIFGTENVRKIIQGHCEAINTIEEICQCHRIDCQFERLEAHLFQESESDDLEKEYETLLRVDFQGVRLEKNIYPFFSSRHMLSFPRQAQFQPLEYIKGLTKAILERGGKIFTNAHIVNIQGSKEECHAMTSSGLKISASQFIVATNTPINNRFMMHTKQAAYRTYAIGANIAKGSVPKGLYYDTLDPYHYVRIHSEDLNDLLIIGGEDHKTGQDNDCRSHYQKLETWAKERFPMISDIPYHWSGQVLEPVDSLGFMGKNPIEDNVFIITGHSGNGLTYSTLGAMIIKDLILEKDSPYEEIFRPSRKTLSTASEFIKENINVSKQYGQWLRGDDNNFTEIPPDSGKIVDKKIAIYKDNQGKCHFFSAVCPHLGCIVNWNNAEKTWDCPCHGSRFQSDGQVICGPATADLKVLPKSH